MKATAGLMAAAGLLCNALPAMAHHSYSMFDMGQRATVTGTVAKIEWSNPHVFIWMYVQNDQGVYDLYGFEAGAVSLLTRYGWSQSTVKSGEKATVEYFPLKDHRPGGAFIKLTHADGSVSRTEPFAPGGSDASSYRVDGAQKADK